MEGQKWQGRVLSFLLLKVIEMIDNLRFDLVEILIHLSARYLLPDSRQQRGQEGLTKAPLNLTDVLPMARIISCCLLGNGRHFFGKFSLIFLDLALLLWR